MAEVAKGENLLPPTRHHQLVLFGADATTVSVRHAGQAGWRSLRIGKGEVVLRPAGLPAQENRWQSSGPVEMIQVFFNPAHLPAATAHGLVPDTIFKLQDPMVGMLMSRLHCAAIRQLQGQDRYVDAASELLCLHFAQSLADAVPATVLGALTAPLLRRICAHIEAHLEHPVRLAELAAMAELSPSYFLRAFKASTTMTPVHFAQTRRVLLAQKLLRSSKKSLVEIAFATGFGSQSRFTNAFHSIVGESPARYRKAHAR